MGFKDIKDEIIFDNISLSDLFSNIYQNSRKKQKRIDSLLERIQHLVTGINDASILLPIIKDILEVAVKNDEQLIKLSAVIQRIITGMEINSSKSDNIILSEEEKKQLIEGLSSNNIKSFNSYLDEKLMALENQVSQAKQIIAHEDKKLIEKLDGKEI